ncbi:MAG: hypothetical protein H0V89_04440 [Deltaproteobacteria bacterium]|nr:hypothetical protein [Deltaproteobacteria bacterium]
MDTKWVVGAAVAAFLAFGAATWWLTSEPASATPTSTAELTALEGGKQEAKARKAGAQGKARKGGKVSKGKAKAGKGKSKAGKGKAKVRGRQPADPAEAAAKWSAFRDIVVEGGHARVAEFGEAKDWDAAKVTSVQKLLDDGVARLDGVAARVASGELDGEAAQAEIQDGRRDMQASLFSLLGEVETKEMLATMRPAPRTP